MRRALGAAALCVLMLANGTWAEKLSGDQVIAWVRRAFGVIRDYRVDARMSVKGSGINLENLAMTVYYEKPDKVHIEPRNGTLILPPEELLVNPIDELTGGCRADYLKTQKKAGCDCHVVRLTAKGKPAVTLWVDKKHSVIVATESAGDKSSSTWRYKMVSGRYYVPVEISAVTPIPGATVSKSSSNPEGLARAKVTVSFSNYTINKGIDDKVFEHKPRK